ncbi:MAG: hypothetical protein ACRD8W_05015 [Nitrososphaeraceae archaeon]
MHGKNKTTNTGHTAVIFEKNKDGSYTRNSLLYQDILKYCINGKYKEDDSKSFRLWSLTKWLLETNVEFINHFKDPSTRNYKFANRIEDRLPRIKGRVQDLVDLDLIIQTGIEKESKGTGTVPIFRFTIMGQFVSLIVQSLNASKREYAINQLYDLLQNHLRNDPSSTDIFNSIYFEKCKEHGLFGNFIDRYKELLESDVIVTIRQGFFQRLLILPKYNIDSEIGFWTLFNESVGELDLDTRLHFFHHIKLDIERRTEDECHVFGEFEKVRYACRDNPNKVTIEGLCKNCGFYTVAAFSLDKYIQSVFEFPNGVIIMTCSNCKKDGSIEFSMLI